MEGKDAESTSAQAVRITGGLGGPSPFPARKSSEPLTSAQNTSVFPTEHGGQKADSSCLQPGSFANKSWALVEYLGPFANIYSCFSQAPDQGAGGKCQVALMYDRNRKKKVEGAGLFK